ncbi:hypothetical protein Hdeb2414_s0007g00237021 [Helianthus debilis subsp. tardiflorus]
MRALVCIEWIIYVYGVPSMVYYIKMDISFKDRKVAYRLDLPPTLDGIHNTFHVSQLRKCLTDETTYVPFDDIELDERMNYVERPIAIKDSKVTHLLNKAIRQVLVQWQHQKGLDLT